MEKGVSLEQLKVGTQIACVPDHADSLEHEAVEFGFVFSVKPTINDSVFVRYWSKHSPGELRTKANSELTPLRLIVLHESVPHEKVMQAIGQIYVDYRMDQNW